MTDHLITTDETEKNLLIEYRKLNRLDRKKCLVDAEWILNNPKTFGLKKLPLGSRKKQKVQNMQELMQMTKSIKKITLRG